MSSYLNPVFRSVDPQYPLLSGLLVSEPAAAQTLLIGGAGIGRLPDYLATDALARGTLVRVLPEWEGDTVEAHALYPSHRSLSAKVRVFVDALAGHLKKIAEAPVVTSRTK